MQIGSKRSGDSLFSVGTSCTWKNLSRPASTWIELKLNYAELLCELTVDLLNSMFKIKRDREIIEVLCR